jgi:hypothetical protein
MAEAHGSVGPIGTNRARSVKRRHALPYKRMRRLDSLFAANIASIELADAEIMAYNLRMICGE